MAIALNDAISKSGAVSGRFGSTKSDYKEWLNTQDYASGYIDATLSINNVPTKIVGYNNTKVTELAADNVGGLGTDFVDFLILIVLLWLLKKEKLLDGIYPLMRN